MHWLDPAALPAVKGRVRQFTINPHGDVDGVVLDDLSQIHVPPHMGAALRRLVAVGDVVEARYVKPRDADVFAAVSVSDAGGRTIVDEGPVHGPRGHRPRPQSKPAHVASTVRRTLFAPKGEVCGALLDDGTQLRVDPKANADLADYFRDGAAIEAWGDAFVRGGVRVVDVAEIAFATDD